VLLAAALLWAGTALATSNLINVDFVGNSIGNAYGGGGPSVGPNQTGAMVLGSAGDQWNGINDSMYSFSAYPSGISTSSPLTLTNADGTVSSATMSLTADGSYNSYEPNWGSANPFVTGASPYANLMQDYLYANNPQSITLSGLKASYSYDLVLYSAGNSAGRTSTFIVNGVTQTSTYDNVTLNLVAGVDYVEYKNAVSDASGNLVITFGTAGGESDLNGFQLGQPIVRPVISNLYPDGSVLMQATNKLTFTAAAVVPILASGVQVVLDGTDVSTNLVVTGAGTTNVSVSYPSLALNQNHTATITVTDTDGISSLTTVVNFDTYNPAFTWEAEDYDFSSGQYINSPILSSTAQAGSYFGVSGTQGIDFNDYTGDGPETFRPDHMSTAVSTDAPRQNYVSAGVSDYIVGYFNGSSFTAGNNVGLSGYNASEWVNYTRNFPAGTYNIVGRLANGNGGTASVPLSLVTSGWGTSAQTTTNLGTFVFPATGWASWAYVPLTDRLGNRVKVTLTGTNTLRVTAGSGANLNFFMLVAANTEQPTLTGLYPDGSTLLQGTNKLAFTVSSASHMIAQSNVVVTLNGLNISSNLVFMGSSSSWNVSAPLALNVTNYVAVITVADNVGNARTNTVYFDTFNPASYDIEAEDFDFNGGQFIDNPVITSVAAVNSYFNQVGVDTVDSYSGGIYPPVSAPFRFRGQADTVSSDICSDTPTRELVAAQLTNGLAFNYNIAYWNTNAWLNYSHNYPAGTYWVYARMAGGTGLTNSIQLDKISAATTNYLGTFTGVGRGYNFFDWIPLVNTNNSQIATVTLGGLATLRTTSITGNVNPNSYLLVPQITTSPVLQYSYSGGVLTLTWSDSTFHLQTQVHAPGAGLNSSWVNYPGGTSSPVMVTNSPANGSVFFRLSN